MVGSPVFTGGAQLGAVVGGTVVDVPNLLLLVNKGPSNADLSALATEVSSVYGATVAGVLPLAEAIVSNASGGLFAQTNPDHPWSTTLAGVATQLVG